MNGQIQFDELGGSSPPAERGDDHAVRSATPEPVPGAQPAILGRRVTGPASAERVEATPAGTTAAGARGSGLGVASLVIAVAFVGLFHGLLQYLPLVIPPVGLLLGSTEGSHALLWSDLAGMVVAVVLGAGAIVLRRGRGHGIAAVIIAASVSAYLLEFLIPFGGRG